MKTSMPKRMLSGLMAAMLTLGNVGLSNLVYAAEMETESVSETEALTETITAEIVVSTETEPEVMETEAEEMKYRLFLPNYEEVEFKFDETKLDKEYMKNSTDEQFSAVLLYIPEEKVELSWQMKDGFALGELELADASDQKYGYDWTDTGISFLMPETDLMLRASFTEIVPETEVQAETEEISEMTSGNDPPVQERTPENASNTEFDEIDEVIPGSAAENESEAKMEGNNGGITEEAVTEMDVLENTEMITEKEMETEIKQETSGQDDQKTESYPEKLEADGLPEQGSIVQMPTVEIPFDTWEFDVKNDFTNISYAGSDLLVEYVSDDIVYDVAGTYSCIYKVTDPASGKFWFVLRPVTVLEAGSVVEGETENTEILEVSEDTSSEEMSEEADAIVTEGSEFMLPDTLVYYSPDVDDETAEQIEAHNDEIMLLSEEVAVEEEEEGIMLLAAASSVKSKTFNGKNLISSMSGTNRITNYDFGSSPNAWNSFSVALSSTAKNDIKDYLEANGSQFDDSWEKISVYCGDSDHERLGWMEGMGQLSNASMKVTLYDTDGEEATIEKIKVTLRLYPTGYSWVGSSYFQTMVGSKTFTTSGAGGTLRIAKRSDCTAEWMGRNTNYYVSTTFGIYDDASCSDDAEVASTQLQNDKGDPDRTATSDVFLPEGTYWIKEISRSPGHQNPDGTIYGPFTVKTGETTKTKDVLGGYILNYGIFAGLNIHKKDQNGNAVPECIFKVTGSSATMDEGKTFTWFFKTDANGEILYDEAHLVSSFNGTASDPLLYPKGTSAAPALPVRMNLKITEVAAPENYIMDTATHSISTSFPSKGSDGLLPRFYTKELTVQNSLKEVTVEVSKKDQVRGTSLAGAVYGIFSEAACGPASKVTELPATDTSGYAKVSFIATQETYYLKELTAPKNYAVNVEAKGIHVVYGQTSSHTVTDQEVMGQITMYKEGEMLTGVTGTEGDYNFAYTMQKLSGAKFRVTAAENIFHADGTLAYEKGTAVGDYVTGVNGSAVSGQLPLGTYTVTEIAAPENYVNEGKSVNVTLSFADQNIPVVSEITTIQDKRQKAEVSLEKLDVDTKNPLSGGVFGIYAGTDIKDRNGTTLLKKDTLINKAVTGEDGRAVFGTDLPIDNHYYVKEITAPNGYLRNEADVFSFEFFYTDEQTETQTFSHTFANERVRAEIELLKVDKETGKAIPQGGGTLSGAVYGLYAREDIIHPDKKTGVLYKADSFVAEFPATDETGKSKVTDLYLGRYYVQEITAPTGYLPDETQYEVHCNYEGDLVPVVKRSVTSAEQVVRGSLSLMKYLDDDVDASILQDWIKRGELKGISFTLRSEDPTQEVITITTDKYGHAATGEKALVYGKWYLEEVSETTPEGYQGLKETEIMIDTDQEELKYVVTNQTLSWRIQIVKRDADTGNVVPLPGARFQVLDSEGNAITMRDNLNYREYTDVFTTDEEGMIELTQPFKVGTYTIVEVEAPDGYLISDPVVFELKDEKQEEVQLTLVVDYPDAPQMGQILVTKVDVKTQEKIGAGFTYEITVAEDIVDASGAIRRMTIDGTETELKAGTKMAVITTDETSMAVSPLLYLGSYEVKEVVPGEYYALNDTVWPVTLHFDKQTELVEVPITVEDKKTELDLYKVDAEDGDLALGGITFRVFSSSDKNAEKVRLVAEQVAALRAGQELLRNDFMEKQAKALEMFAASEDVTEEQIATYSESQALELANYWASLEAEQNTLELRLMEELEVTDISALGEEYVTDETGHIHVEDLLHGNTYYIYETATLPGYNLDSTIHEFQVDENGLIDGKASYVIEIANKANVVDISKVDVTGEKELPGAELTIADANGNVVESWVSAETPHRIKGLAAGIYTLTEVQAPKGYAIADSITFTLTDSLEIQKVIMVDELIQVEVSKKDITNEEELPGAVLVVRDEHGTVMDEWISEEEPHLMNLPVGTYTLTEMTAPDGYVRAAEITFEVEATGEIQKVTMVDDVTKVQISKVDMTTEEELPGAHLVLKNADGEMVDEWVSSAEPHYLEKLPTGEYVLTETIAPDGYVTANEVIFTVEETGEIQSVQMADDVTKVQIKKTDLVTGEPVIGATLTITDQDGTVVEEWVTTEEEHYLEKLPVGEYTLTEISAPTDKGYVTAESVIFTVEDTGEIQTVEMKDDHTKVEISKKDITNNEELPGAKLTLKNADGEVVDEWVSKKKPHLIEQLPIGSYTLTEVTAPDGYEVAESMEFEVTDTMEVQSVTMYDAPKDETVDLTGKKTITKVGSTPVSPGTPGNVIAAPVQTGDMNRLAGAVGLLIAGLLSGYAFVVMRKKDKK